MVMKNFYKLISVLSVMLISPSIFSQAKPFGDSLWTLVFSDEFSGTSVDASKWNSNWMTNQQSSYVYDNWNTGLKDTVSHKNQKPYETWNFANVNVGSGTAKIISKKENYYGKVWDRWIWNDCWVPGNFTWCPVDSFVWYKYTTGLLISKAKFKYGYFEMKIRLPDHSSFNDLKGLGPACFLYSSDATANWSEIDWFEYAGKDDADGMYNKHTSNVHYMHCSPQASTTPGCNTAYDINHWYAFRQKANSMIFNSQFHKIAFNWTPDKIDFYIDDTLFHHVDSTISTFLTSPSKLIEMPIITGISHPTSNFATDVDTVNTVFPYNYEIDYIRVWQYKQYCDSTLSICSFTPSTFNQAIYKQINAGSPGAGVGCTPTVNGGQSISYTAQNFVLLEEGFNVQSGTQFIGDTKPCINFFENVRMGPPNELPYPPPSIFYERVNYKKQH